MLALNKTISISNIYLFPHRTWNTSAYYNCLHLDETPVFLQWYLLFQVFHQLFARLDGLLMLLNLLLEVALQFCLQFVALLRKVLLLLGCTLSAQ